MQRRNSLARADLVVYRKLDSTDHGSIHDDFSVCNASTRSGRSSRGKEVSTVDRDSELASCRVEGVTLVVDYVSWYHRVSVVDVGLA